MLRRHEINTVKKSFWSSKLKLRNNVVTKGFIAVDKFGLTGFLVTATIILKSSGVCNTRKTFHLIGNSFS